jgi:hypothetical protein
VDVLQNPDSGPVVAAPAEVPRRGRSGRERAERSALAMLSALLLLWTAALWAWTVRP